MNGRALMSWMGSMTRAVALAALVLLVAIGCVQAPFASLGPADGAKVADGEGEEEAAETALHAQGAQAAARSPTRLVRPPAAASASVTSSRRAESPPRALAVASPLRLTRLRC